MKNKLFYYLVIILFIIVACHKDDTEFVVSSTETSHAATRHKIRVISAEEIPNVINHIAYQQVNFIPELEHQSVSNGNDNPFGTIDLAQIQAIINNEMEQDRTYTFSVVSHPHITDSFSNLIVRVIDGQIIRSYVNVYKPTTAYLQANGLRFGADFSGTITSYTLEDINTDSSTSFTNTFGSNEPVQTKTLQNGQATSVETSEDCPDGTDLDGDGVVNGIDNCIATANPDQTDSDGDGIGNVCDATPYGDNNTGGGSGEPGDPHDHDTGTGDTSDGGGATGGGGPVGGSGSSNCSAYYIPVWVPCSSEEGHGSTDHCECGTPGSYCTPGYWEYGWVEVCGGTFFTGNDTTNTSVSFTGELNADPCPDDDIIVINPTDPYPCSKLNDYLSDPDFKAAIDDLETRLNQQGVGQEREDGYEISMDATTGDITTNFVAGEYDRTDLQHGGSIIGGMHIHHADGYPLFSGQDLQKLLQVYNKNTNAGKTPHDMLSVVVTKVNGQNKVFVVTIEHFVVFRAIVLSTLKRDRLVKDLEDAYRRANNSTLGHAGALLKQMEDYYEKLNLPYKGLNLFQLNDTGTAFEKITLNQNNEAESNPCN